MAAKKRKAWRAVDHFDLSQVEKLASIGLTMQEIASAVGVSDRTLRRKIQSMADLADAIERGRHKGTATILNAMFKKASSGDVPAAKWWLSVHANRTEKTAQEHTGKNGGPIEIDVNGARERLMQKLLADG